VQYFDCPNIIYGQVGKSIKHALQQKFITCPESNEEIILLNPIGIAIEDIACAQIIYQKALTTHLGTWLDLN
jgi:ornithine cyclodeaminase/alanine dehydrogenase-like protein (mu-crystallin family)